MKTLIICLSLLSSLVLQSQVIPDDRTVNWNIAGYPGIIPDPSDIIDITALGAIADGVSPVDIYINQAMDSLTHTLGVIYFPPGNYLINTPLTLPGPIILRGAGSDSSKLIFDFNGAPSDCIDVSAVQNGQFVRVLSGFEKGSTHIAVTDASNFSVNGYAEMRQENGTWDTKPVSYADYSVGQIIKITAINSNTLELENPLRLDYDTSLNLEIRPVLPAMNVGIECLLITRRDTPVSESVYNINFQYTAKGWVKGVESNISMGSHIMIEQSTQIEVSGCYFHHSFGYDGVGTRGYGVTLRQHAGECLIENNIFQFLRHAMMVKEGANGNVFAYNYSIEPNRSEPISNLSGDISLHGHYAFANLFEGNIAQNIFIDHARGQSGPYNTIFRNRAELYGISITSDPAVTNNQNFVGNEVTNNIVGSFILAGSGHFEYGNNINGIIAPAGTDMLQDSSYYLSTRPKFWLTMPWPSIGYPNSPGTGSIPAEQRFLTGSSLTVCSLPSNPDTSNNDTTSIVIRDNLQFPFLIGIFPNPVADDLFISVYLPKPDDVLISITDMFGKNLLNLNHQLSHGENVITLPCSDLQNGVYILRISNKNHNFGQRIIKL